MKTTRFLFAGALASSAALGACSLFFEFNAYDTTETAPDGAAPSSAVSLEAGSFELVVPDAATITPGTTAHVPIAIVRHDDGNGRVTITVPETPAGLAPVLGIAIEPDASTAVLDLQALATAPPSIVPLHLDAVEGAESQTKDIALTLHGPPCSPDFGFGPEANGVVHVQFDALGVEQPRVGLFLGTEGTGFVFATTAYIDGAVGYELDGFDEDGAMTWTTSVPGFVTATMDENGGVFVFANNMLQRLVGGAVDPSFMSYVIDLSGSPPTALSTIGNAVAALVPSVGTWDLLRWNSADGGYLQGSRTPVITDRDADLDPVALASSSAALFACGTRRDSVPSMRAAYSRWELDGGPTASFGVNDLVTSDVDTRVIDCAADNAGIIAVGARGSDTALFSIRADGTIDPAFGSAGAALANVPAPAHVVIVGSSVLVLSEDGTTASVSRYSRTTGAPDPTFGTNGQCVLDTFGLGTATEIAVTNDGKLLVLGGDENESIIGRFWL